MPINRSDIEIGGLYKTVTGQERVVLGCDGNGNVVYATRGSAGTGAKFNNRVEVNSDKFVEDCDSQISTVTQERIDEVISDVGAGDIVQAGSTTCL